MSPIAVSFAIVADGVEVGSADTLVGAIQCADEHAKDGASAVVWPRVRGMTRTKGVPLYRAPQQPEEDR